MRPSRFHWGWDFPAQQNKNVFVDHSCGRSGHSRLTWKSERGIMPGYSVRPI